MIIVKGFNRKKAVALYETRLSPRYAVMTVVFYIIAAIIWYILAATVPYAVNVKPSAADLAEVSIENLSASSDDIARATADKERALLMPSGESSFRRRLKLVADAQNTIDFMVYDTYEQDFSMLFYAALLDAADRNVKIRIIVDGKLGALSGSLDKIGRLLQNNNNIEFYYFNTLDLLNPRGLMTLLHDKMIVVDGKIAIVGGVNMGRGSYLGNYDMEVMVTNSSDNGCAGAIRRYFDAMIDNSLTKRIVSNFEDLGLKTQYVEDYRRFVDGDEFDSAVIDYEGLGVPVDKVTHLYNEITDGKKSPKILQAVYNLAENSDSVTIVTPYTLLENDKKRRIRELAEGCSEFRIVTNSLYNTRNVAYADYYYTRKAYITDSIGLYEYQADDQLHAKMYTFDGRYSIIGSFNLDERSAHIDTESVLVIDSPEFTAIVDEYIDDTFVKNSLRVGSNNAYLPSDTVGSHDVAFDKRFKYWIYSALGVVRCLI